MRDENDELCTNLRRLAGGGRPRCCWNCLADEKRKEIKKTKLYLTSPKSAHFERLSFRHILGIPSGPNFANGTRVIGRILKRKEIRGIVFSECNEEYYSNFFLATRSKLARTVSRRLFPLFFFLSLFIGRQKPLTKTAAAFR